MEKILVDAGPLIALFDRDDAHHNRVRDVLGSIDCNLLSTWPVLTETMYMLDYNRQVPADFLSWVDAGGLEIFPLDSRHIHRIKSILWDYRDLPSDLADASLLAAAESTGIRRILTFDSDFEVYRTTDGANLENILR